jgi:hypothetical protein
MGGISNGGPTFEAGLTDNILVNAGIGSITIPSGTDANRLVFNGTVWETVASGAARICPDGLYMEGQHTNNILYCRDFTNAAWTKTNVTAAKDATGIDGAANSASSLTASANNGTCLQSVTIASAKFYTSFRVRRKTGTGTVEITDDGGSNYTDITSSINSSTYTRVSINRTQANPSIGFRLGTSGDAIEVDFACLGEDDPYAPIETTSSATTVNADTEYTIDIRNWPDGDVSVEFELTPYFNEAPPLDMGIMTPQSGFQRFLYFGNVAKRLVLNDGTAAVVKNSAWTDVGDTIKVKAIASVASGKMNLSADGVTATEGNYDDSFSPNSAITLAKSLTRAMAIKNLKIYPVSLGDGWLGS